MFGGGSGGALIVEFSQFPRLLSGLGSSWSAAALRLRRRTAPYRPACQLADRALGRAAAGRLWWRG
jgi:hypothetical protein